MSQPVYGNALLATLPVADCAFLHGALEPVNLPLGQVLFDVGAALPFAYFPSTAIVSLIQMQADGAAVEVAMVGREGVLDAALLLAGGTALFRGQVLSAGCGYRLPATALHDLLARSTKFHQYGAAYVQALLVQIAQTALCNRHHRLDQQLCRWLLQNMDRLELQSLTVTQELIAGALGVRREGVTEAAGKLQTAGIMHYSRGHIEVTDRAALERQTCECYRVMRAECARLLPYWQPCNRLPAMRSHAHRHRYADSRGYTTTSAASAKSSFCSRNPIAIELRQ